MFFTLPTLLTWARIVAIPLVLEELFKAGVRHQDIKLICSNGLHRKNTPDEIRALLGPRVPVEGWTSLAADLSALQVELLCDGEVRDRGCGEIVLDGPLHALKTMVDAMAATTPHWRIRAGEFVSTGTITDARPLSGDLITAGTVAFRVDDLSRLLVDVQIPEVDINRIRTGQQTRLTFDGILNKEYNGIVTGVEACDDGNLLNGDTCNPTCNLANTTTLFVGTPGTAGR